MKVDLKLVNADTIKKYQENGVCVVRNLISREWIARMSDAVDRILINPSPGSIEYTPDGKTGRRRGLALRYIGEDVTWDDRPGTFVKNPNLAKTLPEINLADGEAMHGELFPVVWQR